MLCFRCGTPVGQQLGQCPNCGQNLGSPSPSSSASFAELQKKLRESQPSVVRATGYQMGEVVRDRYEITDVLGVGPLGVVYKALDQQLEVDVALKVVSGEYLPDDRSRRRFVERISELRALDHPGIVRYFDADRDGDRCFYATQFLEGLSLRKIIDLRREKGQRFSFAETLPIWRQLCAALADGPLVHGGLKPQNIILLPDVLKVTDVGLAAALPREAYLASQRRAGDAFAYLAPEVRERRDHDSRADVYTIAAVIVELLTGEIHRSGPPALRRQDAQIPHAFEQVVADALSPQPAARQRDVVVFVEQLESAVGEGGSKRSTLNFPPAVAATTGRMSSGDSAGVDSDSEVTARADVGVQAGAGADPSGEATRVDERPAAEDDDEEQAEGLFGGNEALASREEQARAGAGVSSSAVERLLGVTPERETVVRSVSEAQADQQATTVAARSLLSPDQPGEGSDGPPDDDDFLETREHRLHRAGQRRDAPADGDLARHAELASSELAAAERSARNSGREVDQPRGAEPAEPVQEGTQQLDPEDLEPAGDSEVVDAEQLDLSDPRVAVSAAPPSESTQQLDLEDVEFSEDSRRAERALVQEESASAESTADDHNATMPRIRLDGLLSGDFPAVSGAERGEASSGPPRERTQQVDADMIVPIEEDDPEPLALHPPRDQGLALVSGELGDKRRPQVAKTSREPDDLAAPSGERRAVREARAREALSAFADSVAPDPDAALGPVIDESQLLDSGSMPLARVASAADSPQARGTIEAAAPGAGVAPEVLATDAVPAPLDSTHPVVRQRRGRSRVPLVIAVCGVGVIGGAVAAGLYVRTQHVGDSSGSAGESGRAGAADRKPAGAVSSSPAKVSARVEPVGEPAQPAVVPLAQGDNEAQAASEGAAAGARGAPPAAASARAAKSERGDEATSSATGVAAADRGASHAVARKSRHEAGRVAGKPPTAQKRSGRGDSASRRTRAAAREAKPHQPPRGKSGGAARASNRCNRGMAHVRPKRGEGYCIDRYEAPGRRRMPKSGVTLAAARAACRARGMRLCSAREWMRACGGLFPYGRKYDAERCNTEKQAAARSGTHRRCRSRWGVYDLSGNVAEWVDEGVAMGGHYGSAQGHASCTARAPGGAHTGYRCCSDLSWE